MNIATRGRFPLPGQIRKVFLDLPVELPNIAYTVPQTGAPAVWDMPGGYTGEGIIVAVVDTGIDYEHGRPGGEITIIKNSGIFLPLFLSNCLQP